MLEGDSPEATVCQSHQEGEANATHISTLPSFLCIKRAEKWTNKICWTPNSLDHCAKIMRENAGKRPISNCSSPPCSNLTQMQKEPRALETECTSWSCHVMCYPSGWERVFKGCFSPALVPLRNLRSTQASHEVTNSHQSPRVHRACLRAFKWSSVW